MVNVDLIALDIIVVAAAFRARDVNVWIKHVLASTEQGQQQYDGKIPESHWLTPIFVN